MRKLHRSRLRRASWPSSSTAPSAWRTASRRPRCSWPPASLPRPPRPPSTSPRSAPPWSPASPTTSWATWTGRRSRSSPSRASSAPSRARRSSSSLPADTAKPWVAGLLLALGIYVIYRFLVLGGRRPTFKSRPGSEVPRAHGPRRRLARLHRWRWLGPGRHHVAAVSGRLEPRKVVGSIDTSEFVVAVGGSLGFILALGSQGIEWSYAARPARRRRHRRPDRRLAGQEARRPRARCRGRWPDRADQLQDHRRSARRVRLPPSGLSPPSSSSPGSAASSGRSGRSASPAKIEQLEEQLADRLSRRPSRKRLWGSRCGRTPQPRPGGRTPAGPCSTSGATVPDDSRELTSWSSVRIDQSDTLHSCVYPPSPTTPSGP